jgi:hypothetical protein
MNKNSKSVKPQTFKQTMKNGTRRKGGVRAVQICLCLAVVLTVGVAAPFNARVATNDASLLPADSSVKDLVNIEITSVSKRETKLSVSATIVAVFTPDDNWRLGLTSILDGLRTMAWALPMRAARIYSHASTTRNIGHDFELQSGALAAGSMSGALYVYGEGLSKQPPFTLVSTIRQNRNLL